MPARSSYGRDVSGCQALKARLPPLTVRVRGGRPVNIELHQTEREGDRRRTRCLSFKASDPKRYNSRGSFSREFGPGPGTQVSRTVYP